MVKDRWERVMFGVVLSALVLATAYFAERFRKNRTIFPVAAARQRD